RYNRPGIANPKVLQVVVNNLHFKRKEDFRKSLAVTQGQYINIQEEYSLSCSWIKDNEKTRRVGKSNLGGYKWDNDRT
ncbi:13160_t:CDS:2, partial [Racocetra persica]